MYLLNVHKLKVEWFKDDNRPPYAILSHMWGDGEVSFQDLQTPAAQSMTGYIKITKCCEIAIQDGFDYVWIDTCCIDKTSSAELSEAINSMYQWYQSATVCYAYLSDMRGGGNGNGASDSSFFQSRWFIRGWTLQELLAPDILMFYNRDWLCIGTRRSLQADISHITGIPRQALLKEVRTDTFSIATRMSWAAKRQTTRVEDVAYCLMGIFGVNMPPLYGEGTNAFIRLQGEIMKGSDDDSLFAWMAHGFHGLKIEGGYEDGVKGDWEGLLRAQMWSPDEFDMQQLGLLAPSPIAFEHMQDVKRLVKRPHTTTLSKQLFSMTNTGLHIWMPTIRVSTQKHEIYQAMLNCDIPDGNGALTIYLRRHPSGHYSRILSSVICTAEIAKFDGREPVELYVREDYLDAKKPSYDGLFISIWRSCQLRFIENNSHQTGYTVQTALDPEFAQKRRVLLMSESYSVGEIHMSYIIARAKRDSAIRALITLGASFDDKKLFCAIHSGDADIRRVCAAASAATGTTPRFEASDASIMSTIFPEAKAKGPVILGESIVKHLSNGICISVTFRVSPGGPAEESLDPVSCVAVEFLPYAKPSRRATPKALEGQSSGASTGRRADSSGESSAKARRNRRPKEIVMVAVK